MSARGLLSCTSALLLVQHAPDNALLRTLKRRVRDIGVFLVGAALQGFAFGSSLLAYRCKGLFYAFSFSKLFFFKPDQPIDCIGNTWMQTENSVCHK